MSFFGFDTTLDKKSLADEDLAVYTWGEDSYDGLGDALNEAGDDLNDETFGDSGPVGKDFNFGVPGIPSQQLQPAGHPGIPRTSHQPVSPQPPPPSTSIPAPAILHRSPIPQANPAPRRPVQLDPLESAWPPTGSQPPVRELVGQGDLANLEAWVRPAHLTHQHSSSQSHKFAPFDDQPSQHLSQPSQARVRTLADIEAELRASHVPPAHQSPNLQHMQHQQQINYAHQNQQFGLPPPPPQHVRQPSHQHQHQPRMMESPQLAMAQVERLFANQHLVEQQPFRDGTPVDVLIQQMQRQQRQSGLELQQLEQQRGYPQPQRLEVFDLLNGNGQGLPVDQAGPQLLPPDSFNPGIPVPQQLPTGATLADFPPDHVIHVLDPERRHQLMDEANRKIIEAERMDEKRRRKAAKISKMSKYNDLMTQSDKDFITRIQVSQLVTQDPYNEDFYAQVFSSFVRSRMGTAAAGQKSMLKFANGAGVGVGVPGHRGAGRRENAMAKMQSQVERIIKNAQARQSKSENGDAVNPGLQGALGKISGRRNQTAPRQMLQVGGNGAAGSPGLAHAQVAKSGEDHDRLTKAAGKLGRETMNLTNQGDGTKQPPLTHRQCQVAVERLYDSLLAIEQLNRDEPAVDDLDPRQAWEARRTQLVDELWTRTMVMVPVEASDPHPFMAILSLHKGKRMIPRLLRLLPENKVTLLLVLFVACFHQFDVVREAHVLDEIHSQGSTRWTEVSSQTDAALMILPSITAIVSTSSLRLLTGLLNIMLGNGVYNFLQIIKSQPGIALLTSFMSRVDALRHEDSAAPPEDWDKWNLAFDSLLRILIGNMPMLFPSRRLQAALRAGFPIPNVDLADQVAWSFLAAIAAIGSQQQQMAVVAEVKDMILEIVQAVHSGWVQDPNDAALKLGNVNILLNAIGLDHTMLIAP